MSKQSKWNDELIEELKKLYNEKKYSTKQIGDKLGFSKNAIVGKIHRLELNKTNSTTNSVTDYKPKTAGNCIGKYSLEEIEDKMCVWPFGEDQDITFCGKVVIPGKHYCKQHFEEAYLRFSKRSSKKE